MKMMRYRIRVIALVLVLALAVTIFWCVHELWVPNETVPETPAVSDTPLPPVDWAVTATPAPTEYSPIPEPLFDTYGL